MLGTPGVIAGLIRKMWKDHPFSQITDLGSGSGGPMLRVMEHLKDGKDPLHLKLLLTDLNPNPQIVGDINTLGREDITYSAESVDAARLESAPGGLKTMIASFHHMPPEAARAILRSAARNRQPILIYEIARNTIPVVVWALLLPVSLVVLMLMTWFMTPFVRPLRFSQVVLTYLVPVIPIIYAWDGQASLMRTYSFSDIESFLQDLDDPGYRWRLGRAQRENGKYLGYYLIGLPESENTRDTS